ncbi:MAG: glycoside hydrolase family 3 C-terminal domain-containing protein [Bacteroidota bacterium]
MKKFFKRLLKITGVLLLILLVFIGIVYYQSVNYDTYSLKADKSNFSSTEDLGMLAKELVSQMTLEEKIDQMYGEKRLTSMPKFIINILAKKRFPHVYVGRNERLNLPPWVLSDGPRGARVLGKGIDAVTTFPVAMARGASWDVSLERRVNEVISKEIRANGANYAATPCINLLRHPGWGRAQETYGEDPWHLGEFGVAAVQGIEANNVMACPKHFALNSIENSRWVVNVKVDERTLREVYLPHFKKVIQKGKPASIMSAYNQVRGQFAGSNKELLTDILRNDWGFEGFVSTDWVYGLYDGVAGVKAGLDVEMPWQNAYSYETLQGGIESGEITEEDIDKLVIRSLKTRLKYALIDDEDQFPADLILDKSHIELAKEAAEKSMVLVKNEDVLPFSKANGQKIAVIGRLANVENTGDHGSSDSNPPYVVTPYEGIKDYHEALGNEVILDDGSDVDRAAEIATSADQVVVVVGYTYVDEGEYIIFNRDQMQASANAGKLIGERGEGGDRSDLRLNPADEALIKAIAAKSKNVVVTYVGGSAIDMAAWEDEVPAILFSWYSGMEGGNALANILYGEVNPSGKLPFSIAENANNYPKFNPYIDEI